MCLEEIHVLKLALVNITDIEYDLKKMENTFERVHFRYGCKFPVCH